MFKKFAAVLLSLLMLLSLGVMAFAEDTGETEEAVDSFGAYDHVFIIGVDGAGQFFRDADTPNMDKIFGNQAITYDAISEYVTVSAENWGAILCGVACDVHGFTNGSIEDNQRASDSENPSLFRLIREKNENAVLASFCNWNPINNGIVENDLGVRKYTGATDVVVTNAVCDYIYAGNEPELLFVQMDDVDHAGHSYGCFSEKFLDAIATADRQIGKMYQAICDMGLMENGLFIVVSDHGHCEEGGHGGRTPEEYTVSVAVAGKTVAESPELTDVKNRDVASIALYALGIEEPEHFTSTVPEGLFSEELIEVTDSSEEGCWKTFCLKFRIFFAKIFDFLARIFGM